MKCITFDVTNTLIKVSGSVGYQYSKILLDKFNYKLDEKLTNSNFKKYFIEQNRKLPGYGVRYGISSKTWWSEIVKKLITQNSIQTNQQTNENELDLMSNYLFEQFSKEACWAKYDDCETVLIELKKHGYKLGIISNFDERLLKILTNLNLIQHFDFICTPINSSGYAKPQQEIFLKAFELSGMKARSNLMHIGDDYEYDYKPSIALGFKSLIINHNNKRLTQLHEDKYTTNLVDLKHKIFKTH